MIYHGVECERSSPTVPEIYVCAWGDRLQLAMGLLAEGKGSRIEARDAVQGEKGIMAKPFAVVHVETGEPA